MSDYRKVKKDYPCPICGKPDWCTVRADGEAAYCMRVESEFPRRNGSYYHKLIDHGPIPVRVPPPTPEPEPLENAEHLVRVYENALTEDRLTALSDSLGIPTHVLCSFRAGWCDDVDTYSFPMCNYSGTPIGIHLRRPNGDKFAVPGSRNGLFMCRKGVRACEAVCLCEGVTDTMTLYWLGFNVVGRSGCLGGTDQIAKLCMRWGIWNANVFADNDEPGIRGAEKLRDELTRFGRHTVVVRPDRGVKDVREWAHRGATRQTLLYAIERAQGSAPRSGDNAVGAGQRT